MNNKVIVGAIVAILIIGAAFFMMRPQTESDNSLTPSASGPAMEAKRSTSPSQTPMATQSGTATGSSDTANVKEITVDGTNFKFEPSSITVNKGDTVRVVFKNTQGFHDLVIDEFDVKTKQMQAPGEEAVEFVADKTGTFEYYCSVGQHRQMGMKGTLTVK